MKILSVVFGGILIITALPLQILLHYYFFGKIASISEWYGMSIFGAQFIIIFCQALLGVFLIAKIR